ncbi:arylamine N-acetyltransferase [Alkalibaculum bacchi]|uniref:arylamine N-acetyltransferase family protein n=1 Tax=Alkalibaculum bacchi TaxID=645887 RepID=UPI0026F17D0D|nr:arylamine N-acetyltransferase [Alkalibaculum bacchi]
MSKDCFNIEGYLERINYKGSLDVSKETLYNIHMAHALSIPFENLDVYFKKPVYLDRESLYKKIVANKRGGYCFEMNGLLSIILKGLGFKVSNLLARITIDNGITYKAKTHQVLCVEIGDEKYLLDVGYGNNGLVAPILIEPGKEQEQFYDTFRIIEVEKYGYVLQRKVEDEFVYIYAFDLEECSPADFLMSHHFTSTFSESLFVNKKVCTMPTKEGRITLTDDHFKVEKDNKTSILEIEDDDHYNELLKEHFKLDLETIR